MSRYVLGIDAGTESVRAAVFDDRGMCRGFGASRHNTTHRHPGWAEQAVAQWEAGMLAAIRQALAMSAVPPDAIQGISADGTTCTVVFLDAAGRPLRDAIIWMDVRAHQEAEQVAATKDPALKYVGFGTVSAEWLPCKLLWVKRHEPEVFDGAQTIFELADWLTYRLTGEVTANINTASVRWFYDAPSGGLPKSLYARLGLGGALDKLPARVVRLGEVVGGLRRAMADATGLRPGIPVAGGGGDAFVGMIGLNAIRPGQFSLITGSSHVHLGLLDREVHAPGLFGTYPDAVLPGLHLIEGGQVSTGSVIKWFKDHFVNGAIEREAERRGVAVYDLLNAAAREIPTGSEGLVVLDHWQGNRTPWTDPTSRGVIRGLTLRHTPAHLYRAILEGVAYGTRVVLDRMVQERVAIQELVVCGGATKSDLWMQIHADVTGRPVAIPEEQQATVLGSAILAAVGAGIYGSIPEAADRMVRIKNRVEPDMARHAEYGFYVEQYARTYERLKDESQRLVRRLSRTDRPESPRRE